MTINEVKRIFKRRPDSHKGTYGHVFVIAGSVGMTGAAYLSSQAALLSGSGLVTLGIPKSLNPIMARKLVEVITLPLPETRAQTLSRRAYEPIHEFLSRIDVVAMGPGLSRNPDTQALICKLISSIDKPLIIDADALNALAGHLDALEAGLAGDAAPVLTPHAGEMARLIGKSIDYVQRSRADIAAGFAKKYHCVLVLKGHRTVVASPDGKVYHNTTGNAGMASAGVGDILTGVIASFLGQGLSSYDAARLGVHVHGMAGDTAAKITGQLSLTATDILNKLPEVLRRCSAAPSMFSL
ncbi:MAG: NAD(P)H-hydrate dehydratase [Candidatus Omnitrophota bacterium]